MADWASTERIRAVIGMAENLEVVGDLHLQGRVAQHDGSETPLEMLNRSDPFFPVTLPDGQIAFIAKSQIAVVTCPPGVDVSDPERAGAAKTIDLEVVMSGGTEFRGSASLELPPTRARTQDYLNASGPFFELHGPDGLRFINRAHVRLVRPLD